ncbi:PTS family protein IIC [Klebsiella pneumoniae]|uniref:PTS family protein IIC n=1 Tax=Klebsiella pneumoniae TaxID=573 RepID=A0A377TM68_KLEPN|nr:PTS family protein IIC [Klebsiella pneumoniae]
MARSSLPGGGGGRTAGLLGRASAGVQSEYGTAEDAVPGGRLCLHGNSKVFGSVGIALALYFTAAPENRVKVAGLLIPATLTAMLVGITEPLEFTFLFISPLLFAVHAVAGGDHGDGDVHLRRGGQLRRRPARSILAAKLDPNVPSPRFDDVHSDRHRPLVSPPSTS